MARGIIEIPDACLYQAVERHKARMAEDISTLGLGDLTFQYRVARTGNVLLRLLGRPDKFAVQVRRFRDVDLFSEDPFVTVLSGYRSLWEAQGVCRRMAREGWALQVQLRREGYEKAADQMREGALGGSRHIVVRYGKEARHG